MLKYVAHQHDSKNQNYARLYREIYSVKGCFFLILSTIASFSYSFPSFTSIDCRTNFIDLHFILFGFLFEIRYNTFVSSYLSFSFICDIPCHIISFAESILCLLTDKFRVFHICSLKSTATTSHTALPPSLPLSFLLPSLLCLFIFIAPQFQLNL